MKHLLSNQARIYLAIVEAGSITGAADRLNMGKSGVSDALKQLEKSLGAQLIIRTTRRQSLTTIGEQFYRRCREMSHVSTAALAEISEHLAEPVGPLRITAPHATIDNIVAPALTELAETYPRVQPELIVDDKRLDLIKHNIDVALTVGELTDSEFKAQRIGTLCDVLCASPGFLQRHGLRDNMISTAGRRGDLPYVAHNWESPDIVHHLEPRMSEGIETFRFQRVATASSINAVSALILRGIGVGILPHFFLKSMLDAGTLVELLPEFRPRQTGLYAVHPYGAIPPKSVRVMIDAMKRRLGSDE